MTKREFEKEVKTIIARDGARVVDMVTTYDIDIITNSKYLLSTVYAFRNHVCHRYFAWQNSDETITVRYNKCCS